MKGPAAEHGACAPERARRGQTRSVTSRVVRKSRSSERAAVSAFQASNDGCQGRSAGAELSMADGFGSGSGASRPGALPASHLTGCASMRAPSRCARADPRPRSRLTAVTSRSFRLAAWPHRRTVPGPGWLVRAHSHWCRAEGREADVASRRMFPSYRPVRALASRLRSQVCASGTSAGLPGPERRPARMTRGRQQGTLRR